MKTQAQTGSRALLGLLSACALLGSLSAQANCLGTCVGLGKMSAAECSLVCSANPDRSVVIETQSTAEPQLGEDPFAGLPSVSDLKRAAEEDAEGNAP